MASSSNAATLISSIKTRIAAVLGSNYTELAYTNDLAKNSFTGNFKKYGLVVGSSEEISSVTRYVTLNQTFELILTDSFINTSMTDSNELAKGPVLQDLAFDIYRDLISTKAGSPSTVIMVSDFAVSSPETIQDKTVVIKATIKVKYRVQI